MSGSELHTGNPDVLLVQIDEERDPSLGVGWLAGQTGRETLRLMGVTEENNHESDLASEQKRLRDILADPNEKAWMIQYEDKIIGIIEVKFADDEHIPAPAISIMIGDPSARGKGVGTSSVQAVQEHLRQSGYEYAYARHLTDNEASAALLTGCGFTDDGDAYADADNLHWQNMKTDFESTQLPEIKE